MRNILAGLYWMLLLAAVRTYGETVVWSDGFETNAAKRWTANGVWRIGSPSAGPSTNNTGYHTHSGTNCASTQGYQYNQDSRLVCTNYNGTNSLLIPSATQSPRLRFWHWFNYENALGFVEISTNNGSSWNQISPTYENINSSGVWSRPYLDLSAFAGQNVEFAFHFWGTSPGNGLGWYVDDVAVVTSASPPTLTFPESFEFDPKMSDWSVDFGTWEIGKPTSGPGAAHTGTNCAATVLAGNYANYIDTRLISPAFVVPTSSPTLRFWQWYSFNNSGVGFVEINNGSVTSSSTTNTTITTNATPTGLDTNTYQLYGALNTSYSMPFYWDPATGGWTNATKELGSVYDYDYRSGQSQYYFEGGNKPLSAGNVDYRVYTVLPSPPTVSPTNFSDLRGVTWTSLSNGNDIPVGYFGTNYTYTYTTNTTVTTSAANWNQVSVTWNFSSTFNSWIPESLDLSAYAGQTVQLAFHFGSIGGTVAPGWYVDDINLAAAPTLTVPTNQVISYGQTLTNVLSATNSIEPNSVFTFALAAASTNVVVVTNGVVTWTNTTAPPGNYPVHVQVTDNNTPPFSVTNSFSVTVLPLPSQLVLGNATTFTNGGRRFKFSVDSIWANSAWVVLASTNLSSAPKYWQPIYTNQGGSSGFTDQLSTNFLQRYYRAVFP